MAFLFHTLASSDAAGPTEVLPFSKEALLGKLKVDVPPVVVIDSILPRGTSLPDRVLEIVEKFAGKIHCFVLGHLEECYIYLDGREGLSGKAQLFKDVESVTKFTSFAGVTYRGSRTSDWGRIRMAGGQVRRISGLKVIMNSDERMLHVVLDPRQREVRTFEQLQQEFGSVLVIRHKDAKIPSGATTEVSVDAATVEAIKPVLEAMIEYGNWRDAPALPSAA